jgi:hypothetical protein
MTEKKKKDFFERAIDFLFNLTLQQWLLVVCGILLILIWAVATNFVVILSAVLATITWYLGMVHGKKHWLDKKKNKNYFQEAKR